jgi:hypothetical protein
MTPKGECGFRGSTNVWLRREGFEAARGLPAATGTDAILFVETSMVGRKANVGAMLAALGKHVFGAS